MATNRFINTPISFVMTDRHLLTTFENSFEADLVYNKLQEHNVPVWLLDKKDSAYTVLGFVELYILPTDIEKATALLSA